MQNKAKSSLWMVLLIVFLDWMGIGIVYPMFSTMLFSTAGPLFDASCSDGLRGCYLGLLLAAMPMAQFVSGPILGTLSDQRGRKPIFIFSLLLAIVGYGLSTAGVLAQSVAILIASRFLIGIAGGNAAVVSATIADLSTATNKAKNFGLYSMACGTGFTIGPILGGKLSEIGFSTPFIVAGSATLLNLFLLFFLFSETHATQREAKPPIRFNEGIRNLKKAFQIPGLKSLFIITLLFCFGWSFFFEFLPVTWIVDYALTPGEIGMFYAYGAGFYAISTGLLIRPIVNRFSSSTVLFSALLLLSFAFLATLQPLDQYWLWVYLPIINFLVALVFPTITTMVSNWASADTQGETLGILASVQSAAFALSPLAAGSLLGTHPHMPMAIGGISMLIGTIITGILLRKEIFGPKNELT